MPPEVNMHVKFEVCGFDDFGAFNTQNFRESHDPGDTPIS